MHVDENLTNEICIDIRSIKLGHPELHPSYCLRNEAKRPSTKRLLRHPAVTNFASRLAGKLRLFIQQERRLSTEKERTTARTTYLHACAQASQDIPWGRDWYRRPKGNSVFHRRDEELRNRKPSRKGKRPVKFVSGVGLVSEQDLSYLS